MTHHITLPLTREKAISLKTGDAVYLTGEIFTARDAAHKRFTEAIKNNEPLPISLQDATIFYVGPTPAKPNQIIGACGPTTGTRMDAYAPTLLHQGVRAMIGKGKRAPSVIQAMKENGAVYLGAIGGAGALLASCVTAYEVIAYHDLGTEAVHRLQVKDFPAIVLVDATGEDLYDRATPSL
ncbi:MAG: Fe-S-containing hydro-lyase [Defluviitaleaceae bacterium]|nr:Fe-S-containing hydro-lyase [Defluviitaleaceae bacterium]MCL2273587.1 Fe-S-containing hydro-lyase [Defluviitaleaceae bacterium]